MKATVLLGTLKREGLSNTETLCEFLVQRMAGRGISSEIVKLADHHVPPGTCSRMGEDDGWPAILEKLVASELLIVATPIWWGGHSSLVQRVIERLDELHDEVLAGKPSRLEGKVGGIVITGDSDGAQHVIGNLANFFNAIGLLLPPYATLSVLWDRQAKGAEPGRDELVARYESDYAATADRMIEQMVRYLPKSN
jgi:multimeric flavodoxin WrbA